MDEAEPSRFALPASAAYSRRLEYAHTTSDAAIPRTNCIRYTTSMYTPDGPRRFLPPIALSTAYAMMRERNSTTAFSTPCTRVSVTMSPFTTWLISWPSTASSSERSICAMIWSETATSALFLNAPVANAFGAPR